MDQRQLIQNIVSEQIRHRKEVLDASAVNGRDMEELIADIAYLNVMRDALNRISCWISEEKK